MLASVPPTPAEAFRQTLTEKRYGESLKLLRKMPLRHRWQSFFLLQQTLGKTPLAHYLQALSYDLLYRACRAEAVGHWAEAERLYRLLMQHDVGVKITRKCREGLRRITPAKQRQPIPLVHLETVAEAASKSGSGTAVETSSGCGDPEPPFWRSATSLLILCPVEPAAKPALAPQLAEILNLDPYTARLKLPTLEYRLCRSGSVPEMAFLHQSLDRAGVPSLAVPLAQVQALPVYEVLYLQAIGPQVQVQVRHRDHPQETQSFTFEWAEVRQRVDALLPLLEEVVERDSQGKVRRKTQTQDHAQICDLHLSQGQGILRFYDAAYQFHRGVSLVQTLKHPLQAQTSWAYWQGLKQLLKRHRPDLLVHQRFQNFAESILDQVEILTQIEAHIHLLRRHECYWDQAFHLYSALHYLTLP
ncbi:hypothetical protein [Lyngbya confervoides]|uniref:Bacterial transcriptional activator domain-containing protein n=1 Tax=Lyngbya confervoides BDU141951 TaxID=1574623 RepID=A0ABD4T5A7_9CYAN|nr:hypothetical protein [Lyngbya confervoides]MCM1983427.1 hypothetical protein [Lyngbya confervoides BDU141951]